MLTQKDIDELEKTFVTKDHLDQKLQSLRSDLLDKLDSILKELVTIREAVTIITHRVSDHEDRITKLESSQI